MAGQHDYRQLGVEFLDLIQGLVQIYEPKTMNVRVTTLSEKTLQLLKEYFLKYRPEPRSGYEAFVFINQQRRRMSPRAVQYIVKRLSTIILGEKNAITPHYFRAACAVHLLESGVDIRQVQEIIGWKSLSVVQNYTRVTPQRQAELKKQHHPGFQTKVHNRLGTKEQLSPEKERQEYERRIDELLKTQQELNAILRSQQQLIQSLVQKST